VGAPTTFPTSCAWWIVLGQRRRAARAQQGADSDQPERVVLEGGKVDLPQAVAEHLGVGEGDVLIFAAESDGTVSLLSLARIIDQSKGCFKDLAPGRSLSEELIAERREEARREAEE
jgi:bifunctional DNA-binding transcriptional regulator/antitoxin component of YhaV-PrlF toxin-antitoxin module